MDSCEWPESQSRHVDLPERTVAAPGRIWGSVRAAGASGPIAPPLTVGYVRRQARRLDVDKLKKVLATCKRGARACRTV